MHTLIIEQVLSELVGELNIHPDYRLVEDIYNPYLVLKTRTGENIMMITVKDNEFLIYGWYELEAPKVNRYARHGYILDRRIGIDCPKLIEEIHLTIDQ